MAIRTEKIGTMEYLTADAADAVFSNVGFTPIP